MPSASGKTNLAMVDTEAAPVIAVWTLGDDIAWIYVDAQGQLRAVNPERGFFRGRSEYQRRYQSQRHPDGSLEDHLHQRGDDAGEGALVGGIGTGSPRRLHSTGRADRGPPGAAPTAHPNSRFTAPCNQCPSIAPNWEILGACRSRPSSSGSRRTNVIPRLVF